MLPCSGCHANARLFTARKSSASASVKRAHPQCRRCRRQRAAHLPQLAPAGETTGQRLVVVGLVGPVDPQFGAATAFAGDLCRSRRAATATDAPRGGRSPAARDDPTVVGSTHGRGRHGLAGYRSGRAGRVPAGDRVGRRGQAPYTARSSERNESAPRRRVSRKRTANSTMTDPFQLLAATILSAQCTDVRVNMVTPHLFARYPTPEALAGAVADRCRGDRPLDRFLFEQGPQPRGHGATPGRGLRQRGARGDGGSRHVARASAARPPTSCDRSRSVCRACRSTPMCCGCRAGWASPPRPTRSRSSTCSTR